MTEKRFWYDFEDCEGTKIFDFEKDTEYALETIGDFRKIEDLLNELNDENEELKKENYKLHKRLGDFEQFEEYIKKRNSKTSVNDIVGLVKTDEPTNSVELKKELYK